MGSLSSMFSDFLPSDGTASATPNKHNVNLKHQGWGNQSKIMGKSIKDNVLGSECFPIRSYMTYKQNV